MNIAKLILLMLACNVITYPCNAQDSLEKSVKYTTVITHGFTPNFVWDESPDPWVNRLAEAIRVRTQYEFPTFATSIYTYKPETGNWEADKNNRAKAEKADHIVLIFDWATESGKLEVNPSNIFPGGDTVIAGESEAFCAIAAADAFYAALRKPGGDHLADVELVNKDRYLHLIGHSRGASVNSEIARRLSLEGLPIDHMTALDSHPVNGTRKEYVDIGDLGDPTPERWNTLWFDNYYRTDGTDPWDHDKDPDGISLGTACDYECKLNQEALEKGGHMGWTKWDSVHSNVHLWYTATIDLTHEKIEVIYELLKDWPTVGTNAVIDEDQYKKWFADLCNGLNRTTIGYNMSRIGGGKRLNEKAITNNIFDTLPILYNGSFEGSLQSGVAKNVAGWKYHGGGELPTNAVVSDKGETGGYHLALESGTTVRHNRFYLPENADSLTFKYKANAESESNTQTPMKLKVEFMGEDQTNPYLIIPLEHYENFKKHTESLDDFIGKIDKDRVYTLQFKIDDDSSPGTIELDDIVITYRVIATEDVAAEDEVIVVDFVSIALNVAVVVVIVVVVVLIVTRAKKRRNLGAEDK